MNDVKWFKKCYRRNLVDMHIEDWNDEFFSKFNPKTYVKMLKLSQTQAAMIDANSAIGYCYWPTKSGHMHRGIKGRDIFGEIISLCHKNEIVPLAYYNVLLNNWAYEKEPTWRMLDIDGKPSREKVLNKNYSEQNEINISRERVGICCPNSTGYREFVVKQLEELVSSYDFKGLFIDWPNWPMICYCDSCKKKFLSECGIEIPKNINWKDQEWISFQKKREEWIINYVLLISNTVKKINPEITIEFQFAAATGDWTYGVTEEMGTVYSDYIGGDFYGGLYEQLFINKLFYHITKNKPFEFMTFTTDSSLTEETTLKSIEMLKLHNYIAMSHNGAFFFINAVKPNGTLDKRSFKRMGEVYDETKYYEQYLGGDIIEDVAIYFSFNSRMNPLEKGKAQFDYTEKIRTGFHYPHLQSVLGACKILEENHIPFGVITKKNLDELSKYKILILSDVIIIDEEEFEKIFSFVKNGGHLYASGMTSEKLLNNIFQLKYSGITKENITYMTPTEKGIRLIDDIDKDHPLSFMGPQVLVKSKESECVLAKLVLPYTDPNDTSKFASEFSNPPGIWTDFDSIIYKKVKLGRAIYISYPLEKIDKIPHKKTFVNIIKELYPGEFFFSSNAPHLVEITVFSQDQNNRIIINILNIQDKLPAIPIYDFKVNLKIIDKEISEVRSLTYKEDLKFIKRNNYLEINIPKLELFNMILVKYK